MRFNQLHSDLNDFRRCVDEAPEGSYEEAKAIYAVIGESCDTLMRELRGVGVKADACDLIFEVEAAIYNYVRRSNQDSTIFPTAEGFGASLGGPARERVLAQTKRDIDFLRGVSQAASQH